MVASERNGELTDSGPKEGYVLFDTAIGRCGLAWGSRGIIGVQLPEKTADQTEARLRRRFPSARPLPLPSEIAEARDQIVALLRGEHRMLDRIVLDTSRLPEADRHIYAIARAIRPGETTTYGEIAAQVIGSDARSVGKSMGRNPFPIIVPCHRVVQAGGKLGGFSGAGGTGTKLRLLRIEGAISPQPPSLFDFGDAAH